MRNVFTIAGREISAFAIAQAGRVLAAPVYLPRYRLGRGASVCFDPHRPGAARTFLERFIAKHGLTGQFGFDFIEHADGALHLLECNPRATSGVHLLGDEGRWVRAYFGERSDAATTRPCAAKLAMLTLHGPRALLRGEWRRLREDLARSRDSCARPRRSCARVA